MIKFSFVITDKFTTLTVNSSDDIITRANIFDAIQSVALFAKQEGLTTADILEAILIGVRYAEPKTLDENSEQ